MAEEIKQRISIDGGQEVQSLLRTIATLEKELAEATAKTGAAADNAKPKVEKNAEAIEDLAKESRQAADAESKLAAELGKAGDSASDASGKIDKATDSKNGLTSAIAGSVRSWVSWTAVLTTAISLVTDLADKSVKAAKSVADLGNQINALAVNQGGQVADQTIKDINAIARLQDLGVAGRNELINAASTITDLTPGISQGELRDQLGRVARIRRVAGESAGSGADAAVLLQTAQAQTQLAPDAVADQVAAFLTSGFDNQTLADLYRRGDQGLMAAVYGARDQGLNLKRSASAIPQIVGALDRRDEYGRLSKDLSGLGITESMSTVERLQAIGRATEEGRINTARLTSLLGGQSALEVALPLLQASRPDVLQRSLAEIQSTTLSSLEARRGQSRFVQAADRAAARGLRDQLALEESNLASLGEAGMEITSEIRARGNGSLLNGLMPWNVPWDDFAQQSRESSQRIRAMRAARSGNAPHTTINIGQQYNLNSQGESPFTAPYQGRWE